MKIDLEEFQRWITWKQTINSIPIDEIEFYKNGEKINIDEKVIEDFRFTGLSNIFFIEMELPWE